MTKYICSQTCLHKTDYGKKVSRANAGWQRMWETKVGRLWFNIGFYHIYELYTSFYTTFKSVNLVLLSDTV